MHIICIHAASMFSSVLDGVCVFQQNPEPSFQRAAPRVLQRPYIYLKNSFFCHFLSIRSHCMYLSSMSKFVRPLQFLTFAILVIF